MIYSPNMDHNVQYEMCDMCSLEIVFGNVGNRVSLELTPNVSSPQNKSHTLDS